MKGKSTILVIDHDKTLHQDCQEVLASEYEVACASNYQEGTDLATELSPEIILLEMVSEGADVTSICQQLQANPSTKSSPIMLLSETDEFPDKMFSHGLGAYDILLKPINYRALKAKLKLLHHRKQHENQLSQEAKLATDTALSAMTGNAELGQAIRFVERSYMSNDYAGLANQLMSVMTNLDLNCVLMFSTSTDAHYFANTGNVTPLEKDLITTLHQEPGRFRDFGKRTVTKYSRVSLLVKNMPIDNPDRYGRLKDLFPSMLGAADARVKALDTESALLLQTNNTALSFQQIRGTLDNLAEAYADNQQQIMKVMRAMLTELDFRIPTMGLDDDQEVYLVERIDSAIQEASDLLDQGENLNEAFLHIGILLEHLTDRLNQLVDEVTSDKKENESTEDVVNEEPDDMDIELF